MIEMNKKLDLEQKMNVEIFDTTLRDGEQSLLDGKFINGIDSKLLIAKKLVELGVQTIEAGYPYSSQGDFEAVEKVAREISGPYICALAMCKEKQINVAWNAIKDNKKPTIHVYTFMVDKKSLAAYGIKEFGRVISDSVKSVEYAKKLMNGKGRVEFSAQNATIGNPKQIYELYSKVISAGADVINLPDTAGYSLPHKIHEFVEQFIANVKNSNNAVISIHCHDDLRNATSNSIAAVRAGARQIECTINGIGERAGNTATEEVVMNIKTHKADLKIDTDINTRLFGDISRIVSDHSGFIVAPNKAIVGSNAFKHISGVHQDGIKKGVNYEIMNPKEVGWDNESFTITSKSGKSGYLHRLERLGYNLNELKGSIQQIVDFGKQLSDSVGKLHDLDLRVITDNILYPIISNVSVKNVDYKKKENSYEGTVILKIDGHTKKSHAKSDDGIVDALFSAVDKVIDIQIPDLALYDPRNIGKGHFAEAQVTVVLGNNGDCDNYNVKNHVYMGRASNKDTVEASVYAYVNSINRFIDSNIK